MRTMFDSVDVNAIPTNALMVAGYLDGAYPTWAALTKKFPHATRISITVTTPGLQTADVIDRETGDATPSHAAAWAHQKHHAGGYPVIYVNAAGWAETITAVKSLGLNPRRDVGWWVADWTGKAHRPRRGLIRALACQYAAPGNGAPGHYDISAVYGVWPGVDLIPLSARHRRQAQRLAAAWTGRRSGVPASDGLVLRDLEHAASRVIDLSTGAGA